MHPYSRNDALIIVAYSNKGQVIKNNKAALGTVNSYACKHFSAFLPDSSYVKRPFFAYFIVCVYVWGSNPTPMSMSDDTAEIPILLRNFLF